MSTIARHTPGPWSIDQNTVDLITADCDGEPVCEISQRGEDPDYLSEEERANAKLIAAAPELLRAVELWIKFFDTMPKGQFGKIVCDIGLMNEAFLASASGLRTAGRT